MQQPLIVTKPCSKKRFPYLPTLGAIGFIVLAIFVAPASSRRADSGLNLQEQADKALAQAVKAAEAGNRFLESLDDKLRAKAVFEFDSAKKSGWSNLPVSMVPRNGVRMGDLTEPQKDAALALLSAVLSKSGYQKVIDIMDGDQQLTTGKAGGKGKGGGKSKIAFGKDEYFLAIFGKPSATAPWFVQFGGHHLGVNVTLIGKSFVLSPTHTGAQPASFQREGKTVRPLGGEQDKAFELVGLLDDAQKGQAMLDPRVSNLVLGPGQDGKTIAAKGVKGSALNDRQQAKLLELIGEWINISQDAAAAAKMAEIKSKLEDTYFAWSGPTTKGSAAYFRIQGPTVFIEYAPQQGSTDHIHTVLRDPSDDYGRKLMGTK